MLSYSIVAVSFVSLRNWDLIISSPPERWHVASIRGIPSPTLRFLRDLVVKKASFTLLRCSGLRP